MAKPGKSKAVREAPKTGVKELRIGLYDPGMTPWLRAGLGGLAASVYAMAAAADPRAPWPRSVALGPGRATVAEEHLELDFGDGSPAHVTETLQTLFERSFCLDGHGLIVLPGAYGDKLRNKLEIVAELQSTLVATLLNHPSFRCQKGDTGERIDRSLPEEEKKAQKAAKKAAIAASKGWLAFEIDGQSYRVQISGLSSFVHRDAHADISAALIQEQSTLQLSSWAYPGATKRHIAFGETELEYTPAQALCACFAMVGALIYPTRRGGAIVVPEPVDLAAFGEFRAGLSPQTMDQLCITGLGDAVLSAESALRLRALERKIHKDYIGRVHGILIGKVAWDANRNVRVRTLSTEHFPGHLLDVYEKVCRTLPSQIKRVDKEDKNATRNYYITRSALRAFVTQNLALGQKWYKDFGTATDGEDKPRFLHYYREKDNKGALYPSERKGLIEMTKYLPEEERLLVESVHTALKQRFGAIADENKGNITAMKNRFQGERDKWRLKFSGCKTPDQVRSALSDLFSRGGSNEVLRAHWKEILPLVTDPSNWQLTRDLALVALASYQGQGAPHGEGKESEENSAANAQAD